MGCVSLGGALGKPVPDPTGSGAQPGWVLAAWGRHRGTPRHPQRVLGMLGMPPAPPKRGMQRFMRPCCRVRTGCEGHSSPPGAVPHALGSLTTRSTSNYRREMHPRGGRSVRTLPWHGAWLHRAIRGTKLGFFFLGTSQPEGGMVSAHRGWRSCIGAGGAFTGTEGGEADSLLARKPPQASGKSLRPLCVPSCSPPALMSCSQGSGTAGSWQG